MRSSIYARYQEKGLSLREMKGHRSCDTDLHGQCERTLPGLTAADNASYLAFLIDQSVRLNPDYYRSKRDLDGEVVLISGTDTGIRDKDGQPVIHPNAILDRIPVSEFVNFASIKRDERTGDYGGESFEYVQSVLDEVNGTEKHYQRKLAESGEPLIKSKSGGRHNR